MDQLLITNIDGTTSNAWGIFYTNNGRFYAIYTKKEKDQNGYILLNVVKVLKEVINTPTGTQVTGKYVGVEVTDQSEWDLVKSDISAIMANKQNGTPTTVQYLNTADINGIAIKSFKEFKLRADIINILVPFDNSVVTPNSGQEGSANSVNPFISEPMQPADIVPQPVVTIPGIEATAMQPAVNPTEDTVSQPVPPSVVNPMPSVEPVTPNVSVNEPLTPVSPVSGQETMDNPSTLATPVAPINPFEITPVSNTVSAEPETAIPPVSGQETPFVQSAPDTPVVPAPVVNPTPSESVDQMSAPNPDIIPFDDSLNIQTNVDTQPIAETPANTTTDYEKMYLDAIEQNKKLNEQITELQTKINNIKNIIE